MAQKDYAQTLTFATMVAKNQGWKLSSEQQFLKDLVEGLNTNWNRYGYFLCPCRDSDGSREADATVICPCAPSWSTSIPTSLPSSSRNSPRCAVGRSPSSRS